MTYLEYMICEAESAGEIDYDTRNQLLGALYESIALQRNQQKVDDEFNKKNRKLLKEKLPVGNKLVEARKKASKPVPGKQKTRADRKKVKARAKQYKDDVKNLEDKMKQLDNQGLNITKDYKAKSSNYHKSGANPKESLNQGDRVRMALNSNNSSTLDHALKKGAQAKNLTREGYYKDDRRAIDKRLDKYGTVESTEVDVDDLRMEIYERELTGEITVEEREELLDYLDARLAED